MNAIRLAIGTFTIVPAGLPSRVDRATARTAMLLAPAVGLLLGITAAAVMWGVRAVNDAAYADLLGAALAVGALAYLTRALHLDGLADTVDALGSGKHGEEAVAIARRGDVGAFGVSALVLVLVIDVAALASASASAKATSAVILAVATGRLAAVWACTPGVPAARPEGLGALVAGTVPRPAAALWALALLGLALGLGLAAGGRSALSLLVLPASVLAGLLVGLLVVRRSVRRLGGITGDVLGAAIEAGTAATLTAAALGATFGS